MWTQDDKKIVCTYRGFDIYEIGNGFSIRQFYFFKWTILQDAINHIDRHLGGRRQDTISWKTKPVPDDQISYQDSEKVPVKESTEIKDIYNKIDVDIKKGDLQIVTDGLITLIAECYSKDLIDNKFVESIKDKLDKLEKVIGYVSSNNNNEAKIANEKSLKICSDILISVNDEAKIIPKI